MQARNPALVQTPCQKRKILLHFIGLIGLPICLASQFSFPGSMFTSFSLLCLICPVTVARAVWWCGTQWELTGHSRKKEQEKCLLEMRWCRTGNTLYCWYWTATETDLLSLLHISGCPLHASSHMDCKVHTLGDITYLSGIKSMRPKPGITLTLLSSLQMHTTKVIDARSSLHCCMHSLAGTAQFRLLQALPPSA